MNRMLAASAVASVVAAGSAILLQDRTAMETFAGPAAAERVPSLHGFFLPATPAGQGGPAFVTGLENLPASLAGTDVDDAVRTDDDGHLIVDSAVRSLFDYFLTTVGEEPLATVAARLRAYITQRLAEPARGEALALLESYLAFWQEAGALSRSAQTAPGRDTPAAMAEYLERMRALRSRYFGRDVDQAFFAEQDAYHDYTLARVQVMQDAALTEVQRAHRLGELMQQLPAGTQEALRTATVMQTLDGLTDSCRRDGCSDTEVRRIREALVGAEAADRLEALDREETALRARLADYFLQRDRIAANVSYSDSDRQMQIGALQQRMFSEEEQLRLAALERIHDGGAAAAN
ncbi:MAG: lipase secretion chaperone [Pseudomonadota bacterium]